MSMSSLEEGKLTTIEEVGTAREIRDLGYPVGSAPRALITKRGPCLSVMALIR